METNFLVLDGKSLTLEQIEDFLTNAPVVKLSGEAVGKIKSARKLVEKWVEEDKVIYGVTTGFGEFANVKISQENNEQLQKNLIMSHSVGVGTPLPPFIVKVMMLLRVNAIARGHSGSRLETIDLLLNMINNNIIPVIPSKGSVGSSGDLAPLSHLVLAMIGLGKVQVIPELTDSDTSDAKVENAAEVFERFGLKAVTLGAKEGLALINGTQMMTAFAAYITIHSLKLAKVADIAGSLTHEALRATDKAYDKRLHALRPYDGQVNTAENMLTMISNSEIRNSHLEGDERVSGFILNALYTSDSWCLERCN